MKISRRVKLPQKCQIGLGLQSVVNQAVQDTQQAVVPVEITEPLFHGAGEHAELEALQGEDTLPSEKKKIFKMNI